MSTGQESPLGFYEKSVAPQASAKVTQKVQCPSFRPDVLIVAGSVAEHFEIESVTVDGELKSPFHEGPMSASAYRAKPRTEATMLSWDSVPNGTEIVMTVRNMSDKAIHFAAALVGIEI